MTDPQRELSALKILLLEDNPDDAELIGLALREMTPRPIVERVETKAAFRAAITDESPPDLILSDWSLPQFDGLSALLAAKELGLEIPFIIVSGKIGEEAAIEVIKQGAFDYVIKDNLGRLPSTIRHALETECRRREAAAAEAALRESELKYRSIFQNNHTMMMTVDAAEGALLSVNPAMSAFFGRPMEDFEGHFLFDYIVPDSRGNGLRELQEALAGLRSEGAGACVRKDGSLRDIEISYSPTVIDGKKLLFAIMHDVTEKKKAVESLRLQSAALNAAVDAIVMTSEEGVVEWVNPAFSALTGYKTAECLGRDILDISRLGLSSQEEFFCTEEASHICVQKACEVLERRKDGSYYMEEKRIRPVPAENGSTGHYVIIKQDITTSWRRRRELETDLRLNTIFRSASTPEGIASDIANFLNEQPEVKRAGVLLTWPDGDSEAGSETWFGDPLPDSAGPIGGKTFFGRLSAEAKEFGTLAIEFLPDAWTDNTDLWSFIADTTGKALNILYLRMSTESQIRKITAMTLIDKSIGGGIDLSATLELVLEQASTLLKVDAVAIYALDRTSGFLTFKAGRGFRSPRSEDIKIPLGQPWVGVSAKEDRTTNIFDFSGLDPASPFAKLMRDEEFLSQHCTPLKVQDRILGVLEVFQRKSFRLSPDWNAFFQTIALQTAIAVDFATLFGDLQRSKEELEIAYEATIEGWSKAMDLRDRETEGHTQRVTSLAIALAERMGFEDEALMRLRRGALLHDLGKMGVPDSILNKAGPLNLDEWAVMRRHPEFAMDMLSQIPYLGPSLDIPYCHHEKWDGTGYPRGLKGKGIPEAARIFAVVDVWDALTSDRPYRNAWSKEKTAAYIRQESGKHFDPEVVEIFLEMMGFRDG